MSVDERRETNILRRIEHILLDTRQHVLNIEEAIESPSADATRIVLVREERYDREGNLMAQVQLNNDEVRKIAIDVTDDNGGQEPIPQGTQFTATSSDPTVGNATVDVMSDGKTPALVLNAVARAGTFTATVDDNGGQLASFSVDVEITVNPSPVAVGLDLSNQETSPQAVPAAGGAGGGGATPASTGP